VIRRLLPLLAALALIASTVGAIVANASVQCTEDMPCWTWSKMGNHKRGIVTLYGNERVVGPCEFRRLWETGHIRYVVHVDGHRYGGMLQRMRGDWYAIEHGCES
jgi:hypothetical protein